MNIIKHARTITCVTAPYANETRWRIVDPVYVHVHNFVMLFSNASIQTSVITG